MNETNTEYNVITLKRRGMGEDITIFWTINDPPRTPTVNQLHCKKFTVQKG